MLDLLPALYRTERYTSLGNPGFYHEHFRGLPLLYVGSDALDAMENWGVADLWPLCRVDISIRTKRVSELPCHPMMTRADFLRIWPPFPRTGDRASDIIIDEQCDEFWAENIPVLAASTIIDRFLELNLCECIRFGPRTPQARRNLDLSEKLLEPRVYVDYCT